MRGLVVKVERSGRNENREEFEMLDIARGGREIQARLGSMMEDDEGTVASGSQGHLYGSRSV
jgi:hypothetical protein